MNILKFSVVTLIQVRLSQGYKHFYSLLKHISSYVCGITYEAELIDLLVIVCEISGRQNETYLLGLK